MFFGDLPDSVLSPLVQIVKGDVLPDGLVEQLLRIELHNHVLVPLMVQHLNGKD